MAREMKYMAARYAIMRESVQAKEVVLQKVATADNLADIFTKPLVGDTFRRMRDRIMGLVPWTINGGHGYGGGGS